MYADNTLTPKEAARLCALGTLAGGPLPYGTLAEMVRHFMDRIQGPSLDVMGSSIELLKYEGLLESRAGEDGQDVLAITKRGESEFKTLLAADLRPGATDLNKLIAALKFRFMHLLDNAEQRNQIAILSDTAELELARLTDLRTHHNGETGYFLVWLDAEIAILQDRIDWLVELQSKLAS